MELSFSSEPPLLADLASERLSRDSLSRLYRLTCLNLGLISLLISRILLGRKLNELDSIELLELDGIPLQLSESSLMEEED